MEIIALYLKRVFVGLNKKKELYVSVEVSFFMSSEIQLINYFYTQKPLSQVLLFPEFMLVTEMKTIS